MNAHPDPRMFAGMQNVLSPGADIVVRSLRIKKSVSAPGSLIKLNPKLLGVRK